MTTEYKLDIVLVSPPNKIRYTQQICNGTNNLCPIPTGKIVEIITEIPIPEYFNVSSLFVSPSIYYIVD
ncbi:10570_t:CDS:1, partial [Racocetra fulgida]